MAGTAACSAVTLARPLLIKLVFMYETDGAGSPVTWKPFGPGPEEIQKGGTACRTLLPRAEQKERRCVECVTCCGRFNKVVVCVTLGGSGQARHTLRVGIPVIVEPLTLTILLRRQLQQELVARTSTPLPRRRHYLLLVW